jgi:hypothetical protein
MRAGDARSSTMSDEKKSVSRRKALKILGVVGAAGTVSIYQNPTFAQHEHMQHGAKAHKAAESSKLRFFTPDEMATISAMSSLIIPADDHSPGAKEAGVPAFIDLIVSSSPEEVRKTWRDGLAAVDRLSQKKYKKNFRESGQDEQVKLLEDISRNELNPKEPEEHFFRTVKNLTIDGYYTSEIGIHKDLQYKGNSYAKNFVGCTHPEHKG